MATKVIMPKQGLQMTEGTITQWLVPEGGKCVEGEPLFEMETDKLTITMDSPATGTLLKIVHGADETVEITKLIGVIGEPGEDISAILAEDGAKAPAAAQTSAAAEEKKEEAPAKKASEPAKRAAGERIFSTPRARMRAEEKGAAIEDVPGSGPEGLIIERDVLSYEPAAAVKASPLAKKVAELENVDLTEVKGTGAHGKIMKDDVMSILASKVAERAAAKSAAEAESPAAARGTRLVPLTGMRKAVAKNMRKSLETNAQLSSMVSCDMTNAIELRNAFKKADKKVSFNDIVLMAATRALTEHPDMNASYTDKGILYHDYVNMGVAVAIPGGLIVPNIKNADLMRLEEIAQVAKLQATKAKDNKLTMDDYTGGTFTVSNLGMFGIDNFVAIINPPETGILAVGAIVKKPVVRDDQIVIRSMMDITLSYDHRLVDGAGAAQFLKTLKGYIENPYLML